MSNHARKSTATASGRKDTPFKFTLGPLTLEGTLGTVLWVLISIVVTLIATIAFVVIFQPPVLIEPMINHAVTATVVAQPRLSASTAITSPEDTEYLPIESIPMVVFLYAGAIDHPDTDQGWGRFTISYTESSQLGYNLEYSIPDTGDGYAGLSFSFAKDQDLSRYEFIELTIDFGDPQARTSLFMRDIKGSKEFVPLGVGVPIVNGIAVNTSGAEQTFRIPLVTNFSNLNLKVIGEIGFNSDQSTSREWHTFRVREIKFFKH